MKAVVVDRGRVVVRGRSERLAKREEVDGVGEESEKGTSDRKTIHDLVFIWAANYLIP